MTMAEMETKQIISWLRDKADRAEHTSWTRMMHTAADRLHLQEIKLQKQEEPQRTGHWIIHSSGHGSDATNWAECSECHVCGSPQWKVCPVCETRMVKENA